MKRTPEQVIWDFVQGWLQKAAGDLQAAERLLDLQQDDYFTAAFHAQQAAEKFLKTFLVRHQIPFPKTHDIEDLLKLAARVDATLEQELSSAAMVTPFGVEFRYPGDEMADCETARQAVGEAKQVQRSVLNRLKEYLDRGRP